MAQYRFPQLEIRDGVSPDISGFNYTAAAPDGFASLARVSERIGGQLQDMAEKAATQEGADQAARDIAEGRPLTPTDAPTFRGQAYASVADRYLATERKAAISDLANKAYADHPDNPIELTKALEAARAGLTPTGRAQVDAEVSGQWLLLRSDVLARAAANAQKAVEQQGMASFLADLNQGQATLDQLASGAAVDAGGSGRMQAGVQQLIATLSRYGPREGFTVAGVEFKPDDSRAGAVPVQVMEQYLQKATAQGRKTWVLAQSERLPTETSRRLFAGEVLEKWKSGDPMFAGLDGADMDGLQRHLEAGADRLRTQDRAARGEASQRVRDGIEAFRWGGDVDFDALVADARASGDAGLEAQARFYRDADPHTRGVLATVYARQLGLTGDDDGAGDGAVIVDSAGRPVGEGPRGARNNNPGNLTVLGGGRQWPGQVGVDQNGRDPGAGFAIFATPEAGIAAAKSNLRAYGAKGVDTVAEIVTRWAPASDGNDPKAYAATVARKLGVGVGEKLNLGDPKVVDHLAAAMFAVETPGGPWAAPPSAAPGTPAYAAWAATKEGFTSDPLTYVRGGKNRPALANVPVLVPDGAFAQGEAAAAWGQSLAQRYQIGRSVGQSYGVAPRMLTNQERDYYKAQIDADPQRGVALAIAAKGAVGATGALAMMRELGDTPLEAAATLHIADLAVTSPVFARSAAQGLALQAEGARLPDAQMGDLRTAFDGQRGNLPVSVMQAAQATATAAMLADWKSGVERPASFYLRGALGATTQGGRVYGGPASVNGATTVLPRWLAADHADDALEVLGKRWASRNIGPVWSNGEAVTPGQLADMRLQIAPNGRYRFIWPKSGKPVMGRDGRVFEADLDMARAYVAQQLGPRAVRGGD